MLSGIEKNWESIEKACVITFVFTVFPGLSF